MKYTSTFLWISTALLSAAPADKTLNLSIYDTPSTSFLNRAFAVSGNDGKVLGISGGDWALVTASGALTSTQIAYGNGSNVQTSEAAFAYDSTFNILSVDAIKLFATGVGISAASSGVLKLEGLGSGFDEAINMDFDTTSNVVRTSSPATGVTIMDYLDMSLRVTDGGGNFATLGPSGITVHNSAWAGNYTLDFGGTDGDAETIASQEWVTAQGYGTGSSRTIAAISTVLSGSTWTLAAGTDYYGSTSAARTIVLPGSPTAGDLINITQLIVTSGPITVTLPMVYRAGTASTTTSISLPTGNHALSFEYVNATWVLKDTGVDAEAANTVYGNPTAGALNPVFTPTPVVDSITVDSEAYDATNWNGDDTVPTKNDVRDHLVLLAPLASPTLTGTPAAPTAAAGTDTTQIATTAYVQDEVDSTLTGSHTTPSTTNPLAPTWTGPTHVVFYGATGEIDLPAASGYTGRGIIVYNTGSFTVSLDPNASEVIVRDGTVQTGGVTITLSSGAGNYVALLSDGVRWITLGYKGTLAAGS